MGDSPSAVLFFCFVKCLLSFQCLLSSSGSHRPVDSSFVVVCSKNVSQMRTVQILPTVKPPPTFCKSSVTHLSSIIQEQIAGLYFMHLYFCCPEACTQCVIPGLTALASPGSLLEMQTLQDYWMRICTITIPQAIHRYMQFDKLWHRAHWRPHCKC